MSQRESSSNFVLGVFLILMGIFLFFVQRSHYGWNVIWPMILIGAGFLFVIGFLQNTKNYGLLMPASILLIIGALFLYLEVTDWRNIVELWPTFILAPGIGFLFMFLLAEEGSKLYVPGLILILIAVIFYVGFCVSFTYWPVVLILLGLFLLLSPFKRRKQK
ncbi:MAG: hypothetical protein COT43_08970 [Candidatus Marinimicrobia bacterium CG08_land_8_20_14_0_20_45_22]|nr:MAG: hypothetical protein COT43_08970 [Candidatus Marinimicrobia bacterium CG08_land_8_20_14_0_20_45_22]